MAVSSTVTASIFKDHFSGHAAAYADARPRYPDALFDWLATLTAEHETVWDCGTGNGQAALGLAEHFRQVIATDPSREQIENAFSHEHVSYRVVPGESSGLQSHSVDLVTVAQAVHWFDRPKFYAEVKRVLKPGSVIAVWCYGVCNITPDIDEMLREFYDGTVGPCWPPERHLIDEAYRTIEFPFTETAAPVFNMQQNWYLEQFLAYLHTWSAVQRYLLATGRDPLIDFAVELEKKWGEGGVSRAVHWPLHMRAGRLHS